MKKKIVNGILLVAILFATTSAFVSCKDTDSDVKADLTAKIAALQAQLDNLKGQVGPQGPAGPQGPQGIQGEKGEKGDKGDTPYIGENGNWWIDTTDTGIAAKGKDGKDGVDGKDGKDGVDGKDGKDGVDGKDGKDGVDGKDGETPSIGENGNWWIGDKDTGYKADVSKWITDIEDAIKALKDAFEVEDINDIKAKIAKIEDDLTNLGKRIDEIYKTEVTSLSIDQVVNPMFEFTTPFGVNSNVLIAFFGEKATRHIFFPKGSEEPIVWKGDYLLEGTGNAGKLYVTVNPSSVDFTDKTLKLVSTTGNEAPVELTPLKASDTELKYLTRGENTNAFYETYATIPVEKIAKAYFTWEPTDMNAFKDQIKTLLKNRGKEDIADMLQALTNLIAGDDVPAYRLQAEWSDGNNNYYTYSPANIAAVAIKPLSYAFDIADEGQLNDTPINELEKLETKIVNRATKSESTRKKIWRWLNKFNKETNRWLNNINWALQPTMFIESEDEISRPGIEFNYKTYPAGEITLIPSSWTVELFAPAFKKYIAVTDEDGKAVEGDLLGKVIPGSVKVIPLKIESGKKYNIEYSALDYDGNIRTLNYYIQGK